jgi:hypothetical protein
MDVDFWNTVFQWGSVGLIAVTFFFGAGVRDAGWSVPDNVGLTQTLVGYGQMIRVRDPNATPRHAEALQRILGDNGLSAEGIAVPEMPADRVMLWVGSKR